MEPAGKDRFYSYFIFAVLFCSFSYFFQSGEHNENARFDQIRAIVERQTWWIDGYSHNTADIIEVGKHWYPNKPPGMSLSGAIAWFIADRLLIYFSFPEPVKLHLLCYLTSLFVVSLAGALAACLLFWLLREERIASEHALALGLAYGLATIAFPYSTLFFTHQVTACALLLSLYAGVVLRHRYSHVLAGAAYGFAVSCDYSAAFAFPILLYPLFRIADWELRRKHIIGTFFGLLPFALFLLSYQHHALGSAFSVTYERYATAESAFPGHRLGFGGIRIPDLATLYEITFGLARGLFIFNPWLLFAFGSVWKRKLSTLGVLSWIIICFYLTFNAGYGDSIIYWGGGHSMGPRHLLPAVPFFVILCGSMFQARWSSVLGAILIFYSMFIMAIATAIEPRLPYDYSNPIVQFLLPHHWFGRYSLLDTGVFSNVLLTKNSVAFNLAEILGLSTRLQFVPLCLFWLGSLAVLRWRMQGSIAIPRTVSTIFVACILALIVPPLLGSPTQPPLSGQGLHATFYSGYEFLKPDSKVGTGFSGRILFHRTDSVLAISLNPSNLGIRTPFSAVWAGCLEVTEPGDYRMRIESDDGAAVWIDGALVLNTWPDSGPRTEATQLTLSAGSHDIRIHYFNLVWGGRLRLLWARDGQGAESAIRSLRYDLLNGCKSSQRVSQ